MVKDLVVWRKALTPCPGVCLVRMLQSNSLSQSNSASIVIVNDSYVLWFRYTINFSAPSLKDSKPCALELEAVSQAANHGNRNKSWTTKQVRKIQGANPCIEKSEPSSLTEASTWCQLNWIEVSRLLSSLCFVILRISLAVGCEGTEGLVAHKSVA